MKARKQIHLSFFLESSFWSFKGRAGMAGSCAHSAFSRGEFVSLQHWPCFAWMCSYCRASSGWVVRVEQKRRTTRRHCSSRGGWSFRVQTVWQAQSSLLKACCGWEAGFIEMASTSPNPWASPRPWGNVTSTFFNVLYPTGALRPQEPSRDGRDGELP